MLRTIQDLRQGTFVRRPNRFLAEARLDDGSLASCHLPNPGRMWELLLPHAVLYLRKAPQPGRKTSYDVVGIERDGVPILLDTQYNNEVAAWLVATKQIPGWEGYHLVRREVTVGDSRFDLLLEREDAPGSSPFYVEVKSCTLFGRHGAMFPDAVTERGRKHILELSAMADRGIHTGILFLVHWDRARWFLPDYHTDPAFAEAFYKAAPKLDWKALALRWDRTFTKPDPVRLLQYPAGILVRENQDRGDYMVVLQLAQDREINTGALGPQQYPAGFYVYVGSARRGLAARLARHSRLRKQMHWHIDYLRDKASVTALLPIRTADDLEHDLAAAVDRVADWRVEAFGSTDCHCPSHLFGFHENPVHIPRFMAVVEEFRMNRLEGMLPV